jgi:hypothetical protein
MVEQAQGPPPRRVETQVAMPICDDEKAFSTWCSDRVKKGLDAAAVGSALRSRTRSLQVFAPAQSTIPSTEPFLAGLTRTEVELAHPLKLLQRYSNGDKHRAIRPTVARVTSSTLGEPVFAPGRAFADLWVGDLFDEGAWGVPNVREASPAVMIRRPAPCAAAVSPANEIGRICTWVADTAIPLLVTGEARAHGLARVIEMGDSGRTDLDRLDGGSFEQAADRVGPWFAKLYLEADRRPVKLPRIVEAPDPNA